MHVKKLLKETSTSRVTLFVCMLVMLAFAGVNALNTYEPTVLSDKDDYAPGEVAIITGYGWTQDQTVHVEFKEEPDYPDYHSYDVEVDADGKWEIKYDIEERHLGVAFTVTTTGKQSGYTYKSYFTDAPSITEISPNSGSVAGGTEITISGKALFVNQWDTRFTIGNLVANEKPNTRTTTGNGSNQLQTVVVIAPAQMAGNYNVKATLTKTTGQGNVESSSENITFTYQRIPATLSLSNLTHTYSGTQKQATVLTSPIGLSGVSVTYNGLPTMPSAAGSYQVEVTLNNPYYEAGAVTGTLIIEKATLTIKAENTNREYGNANPSLVAEIESGAVEGEVFSVTASSVANAQSDVGNYEIVPAVSGATIGNYNVMALNGTLTVIPRPITITANPGQVKVYGEPDPAEYSYQISSGSLVDLSHITGALSRTAGENVGSYAITKGSLNAPANYVLTYVGDNFNISKRSITITADTKSKTYGESDPDLTFAVTTGSLVQGDSFSGSPKRDEGENAGIYAIGLGSLSLGNNYTLSLTDGSLFTILPKAITVTPLSNQGKIYGSADPVITYSHTVLVGSDEFSGSLSREDGYNAGEYNITQGSLALSNNYTVNFVGDVKFSIMPKLITALISAEDKVYDGTTNATVTGRVPAVDLVGSDVVDVQISNAQFADKNAGTSKTVTAAVSISNSNYSLNNSEAYTQANITSKPITGSFTAINKVYDGTLDASIQATSLQGVIQGDDVQLSAVSANFADKNVGIGKSVALYGASLTGVDIKNYLLTNVASAKADITPKSASVSPVAKSKVYGTAEPVFTGATSGFIPADAITAAFSRALGEQVGNYTISATLSPEAALANYDITYNTANFDITKAPLHVAADNMTREYGDINPVFTGTLSGVVTGDNILANYYSSATQTSSIGEYVIMATLTGEALSNYEVMVTNGTVMVTKAPLTITANNKSRIYGIANPTLDGSLSGIKNNDPISAEYITTAIATSDVGEYAITATILDPEGKLSNYQVSNTPGKITITQAPATIILSDLIKEYNGNQQGVHVITVPEGLPVNVTYNGFDELPKNAATYNVKAVINNKNYVAEDAVDSFVIDPKSVTAILVTPGKVYNATTAAPGTSVTIEGVIGDDNIMAEFQNAQFDNKNVGTGKTVTADVSINNSNYKLVSTKVSTTAAIAAKPITGNFTVSNKMYDGNTNASILTRALLGVESIDAGKVTLTGGAAEFEDAMPGFDKPVSATGMNLMGSEAANYTLTSIAPAKATIFAIPSVSINNPAPTEIGKNLNISANYTGIVSDAVWMWSFQQNGVTCSMQSTTLNGSVTVPNTPGVYSVYVRYKDAMGQERSSTLAYVPVFDPNGGFVTGGGWINSPEGAIKVSNNYGLGSASATGKANFGFVAKYKKGTSQVEGNTEFQFSTGNLNFKSTLHEEMSLIINADKATYKGVGTLNGLAGFKFTVIAIDGDVKGKLNNDKFRIRIWDAGNQLVYDNYSAGADYDEPGYYLGGGSIVIHEVKSVGGASNANKVVAEGKPAISEKGTLYNYPNSFSNRTTVAFSLTKAEAYTLEVYDVKGALVKKVCAGLAEANKVYEFEVDARNFAEGIYIARLVTGTQAQSIKMILKK